MCGKYMSSSEYKVNDSDDNWYILRFADILLLLAEAEAHISDGILSQSVLNKTINLVRKEPALFRILRLETLIKNGFRYSRKGLSGNL